MGLNLVSMFASIVSVNQLNIPGTNFISLMYKSGLCHFSETNIYHQETGEA